MKEALFQIGDEVQYLGDKKASSGSGFNPEMKPLIWPGMIAKITETHPPEKGIGKVKYHGEWITDYDQDGYNVYENEHGNGRIIFPDDKNDWKLIKKVTE